MVHVIGKTKQTALALDPVDLCSHNLSNTVPVKSKLPPLVLLLAIRVSSSFLSRRFSFLANCVSFLSRITEAFSMGYITCKKPVTCNNCSAVRCQIDGTFQHKICINRLLNSCRTKVILNIECNVSRVACISIHAFTGADFANLAHSERFSYLQLLALQLPSNSNKH